MVNNLTRTLPEFSQLIRTMYTRSPNPQRCGEQPWHVLVKDVAVVEASGRSFLDGGFLGSDPYPGDSSRPDPRADFIGRVPAAPNHRTTEESRPRIFWIM